MSLLFNSLEPFKHPLKMLQASKIGQASCNAAYIGSDIDDSPTIRFS